MSQSRSRSLWTALSIAAIGVAFLSLPGVERIAGATSSSNGNFSLRCYKAKTLKRTKFNKTAVRLADGIQTTNSTLTKPELICILVDLHTDTDPTVPAEGGDSPALPLEITERLEPSRKVLEARPRGSHGHRHRGPLQHLCSLPHPGRRHAHGGATQFPGLPACGAHLISMGAGSQNGQIQTARQIGRTHFMTSFAGPGPSEAEPDKTPCRRNALRIGEKRQRSPGRPQPAGARRRL